VLEASSTLEMGRETSPAREKTMVGVPGEEALRQWWGVADGYGGGRDGRENWKVTWLYTIWETITLIKVESVLNRLRVGPSTLHKGSQIITGGLKRKP
jgi:hypothetical protein